MNLEEYKEFVERYKAHNPVKYEHKKAYFDKRLEELGHNGTVIAEEELHQVNVIPADEINQPTNEEDTKPTKAVRKPRKTASKSNGEGQGNT